MNIDNSQLDNKILKCALRKPLIEDACYLKSCKDMGCKHKTFLMKCLSILICLVLSCCTRLWTMLMVDLLSYYNCIGMLSFILKSSSMTFIHSFPHNLSKGSKFKFCTRTRYFVLFFVFSSYQTFSKKHTLPRGNFISNKPWIVCISIYL